MLVKKVFKNEIDEEFLEIQERLKNLLILTTKQVASQKAQKDKKYSLEKLKKPLLKWKIDFWLAESVLDSIFGKTSQTCIDLKPVIKKEFGRIKMYGKFDKKHGSDETP